MKLNIEKCVFGVSLGKLLGFIVFEWGIKANPEKIDVLIKIGKPKNTKDVEKPTGSVAALGQFIS